MTDLDLPVAVAHGGNLGEAIRRYGIAREHWVDLSTGINPHGYPVPPISPDAWLRLPDDDDDLEAVAAAHYGAARALAVAGTQAAIRALPRLLPPGCVGVGLLTYGEYAPAFERAGFRVDRFVTPMLADCRHAAAFVLAPNEPLPAHLKHLVLVNPNNPGTESFTRETVAEWHRQLASRGGTLIVDEAFADAVPASSLASFADAEGLIVLRSVGKFFGLAGARVGFVLGSERVHGAMRALRGPWAVSGPARVAVRAALEDDAWQRAMRASLADASARLAQLLRSHGMDAVNTALFAWVRDGNAMRIQDCLARDGIWVRRFETVAGLRFGLPPDESAWARLDASLRAARGR
ncbi:threonine-phosphate decarboxylase CobD [Trinickia caryophylli]|uniref:threonine-phosphate decarboxylase n=1 Tax=Trinickia caryophylli TaxID=28094 RepID=A0A1X7FMW6_TRICW|nr:threonine-phosphate decarboxylase CobD [Trinickia caryophylli]PMS13843.1 threonine-phosphate decarboxylase [Trinickia caryophylli]TRX14338.1 threonine-phosphate decarboxylase [Trinickia caryophylli]WQE14172.1 threonine-phosphate decarboxylase CobD [Trinickia caryophylli]SMF55136.1 L-threonine O-3-phosphate decarboxylase [Trinickia caryophylli]GLU33327.1 threonine-phosphate decarboxylase [Trinickia caryophylli]